VRWLKGGSFSGWTCQNSADRTAGRGTTSEVSELAGMVKAPEAPAETQGRSTPTSWPDSSSTIRRERASRRRPLATAAMSDHASISVTVLLEFEWVLRGFYSKFPARKSFE
jgi:hypothetical protein